MRNASGTAPRAFWILASVQQPIPSAACRSPHIVCVYMITYMYTHIYIHTYIHTCIHTFIRIRIYIYISCVYIYTYTYTHIHIHTYIAYIILIPTMSMYVFVYVYIFIYTNVYAYVRACRVNLRSLQTPPAYMRARAAGPCHCLVQGGVQTHHG